MIYLCNAYPDEAVDFLRSGLQSKNPALRGNACTEAAFRNLHELKVEIEQLKNDSDEFVARSAQIAIDLFELS
jgi:hypothetical protein